MSKYSLIHSVLLAVALATSSAVLAQHANHDHGTPGKALQPEFTGDPYLLDTDPVTGEKLGPVGELVVIEHEGRELRFRGDQSVQAFRADPARFLVKVDEALVRQQIPFYPLETCPVSGEELGAMGVPVDLVYRNRLVRLCCKGCKKKIVRDPLSFLARLDGTNVGRSSRMGDPFSSAGRSTVETPGPRTKK